MDRRRHLCRAHRRSVAGQLFHRLALVQGNRFSDGLRHFADLADRPVRGGGSVHLRLLLRERADGARGRDRFPRAVRESRRRRDGRCLADVHQALSSSRGHSLLCDGDLALRVVADDSQGNERRSARSAGSALQPRHLVLSLPPPTDIGSAGHADNAHPALARRDGRDVLAAERHYAASAPRVGEAEGGATSRRTSGTAVRAAGGTHLDRRHIRPSLLDHRSTRGRELHRHSHRAAGTLHLRDRGRRCRRVGRLRNRARQARLVSRLGDGFLRGSERGGTRDSPGRVPEARRLRQRADARDALYQETHRGHAQSVGPGQGRGQGPLGRSAAHECEHKGERGHRRQRAALGARPADADVQAAPGDSDVLRLRVLGRRPVHDRWQVPAGSHRGARAEFRVASHSHIHQFEADFHARHGRDDGTGKSGYQRGVARSLHQGSAAGLRRSRSS